MRPRGPSGVSTLAPDRLRGRIEKIGELELRVTGGRRILIRARGTMAPSRSREATMGRAVTVQWVTGMKVEGAVGPHRLVMDAPPEAGGRDEGPSPAELLLSAIGA